MRLANSSRILLPLALLSGLATCSLAQEHPNVSPNSVRNVLNQAGAPAQSAGPASASTPSQAEVKLPKKPAAPAPAPAAQKAPAAPSANAPVKSAAAAPKSAPAAAAANQKTAAAPVASQKTVTKPGEKPAAATAASAKANEKPGLVAAVAKPAVEKPAVEKPVARRDPFDTLLTKARAAGDAPQNLPPGKAGLIVESLRIDGIVHGPSGMIAIVSNPQQRVYFLRDGDKLYDGSVQKISLDAIAFHETGKDAFGKPLERSVTKRLYPTSGEQQ